MCGDGAPSTGAGRRHTPTGPVGAGPRGAAAARAPPAAGYGDCRRQLAQDGCRRAGPIDDGPARAEARMTGVGGCIRSEHGRSRHAGRSHHLSAFESRAGWPLPPRGQPAGRHGQPPGRPPATYGLAPGRAGRARRPRAQPRASRAASRAALAASHVGGEGQPPWGCHLGQGGPAHLGGWASPISARASPRASPFGGVGQPDWGGGPARSGGRASPIGGVGQPDLGGWLAAWPAG